jgi:hypothetical protein
MRSGRCQAPHSTIFLPHHRSTCILSCLVTPRIRPYAYIRNPPPSIHLHLALDGAATGCGQTGRPAWPLPGCPARGWRPLPAPAAEPPRRLSDQDSDTHWTSEWHIAGSTCSLAHLHTTIYQYKRMMSRNLPSLLTKSIAPCPNQGADRGAQFAVASLRFPSRTCGGHSCFCVWPHRCSGGSSAR